VDTEGDGEEAEDDGFQGGTNSLCIALGPYVELSNRANSSTASISIPTTTQERRETLSHHSLSVYRC